MKSNIIVSEREKGRFDHESSADFAYRIVGGLNAKTMEEHNQCANEALRRAVAGGSAEYSAVPNGCGTVHTYYFPADNAPHFAMPSGDVLDQTEIVLI